MALETDFNSYFIYFEMYNYKHLVIRGAYINKSELTGMQ